MPAETKTQRETWRDWQPEGAPDLELMTRCELVARLNAIGVEVSEGDIRFWEYHQILPRPIKQRRDKVTRAYYPVWMVLTITLLRSLQVLGLPLKAIAPRLRDTPNQAISLLYKSRKLIEKHAPLGVLPAQVEELGLEQAEDELLKELARLLARSVLLESLEPELTKTARLYQDITGKTVASLSVTFHDRDGEQLDSHSIQPKE